MNKLERLEAWADELGNGALWHEWGVPDLIRAARALGLCRYALLELHSPTVEAILPPERVTCGREAIAAAEAALAPLFKEI